MTTHAEYSPSKLSRIIACPGSVSLTRDRVRFVNEEQSSQYAAEGELMHLYMSQVVQTNDKGVTLDRKPLLAIPKAEYKNACLEAFDYVYKWAEGSSKAYVETRVEIKGSVVSGTADLVIVDNKLKTIHVMDYKFGANVFVSAQDNAQLMAYTLGALDTLNLDTTYDIFMHIIQPRMDNLDSVQISYDRLLQWKHEALLPAIANAESEDPSFRPSESACRWCLVKAICKAKFAVVQEAASEVFKMYKATDSRAYISEDEVAKFYSNAAILKSHIKAVEDYIMAELLRGGKVPGYKIVHGRGNRKWVDEALAAKYICETYGLDPEDIFVTEFRSPAQIEKLDRALKKDKVFQEFIFVPQGAPKVVRDTEEAPVTSNPFSSVTEEKN